MADRKRSGLASALFDFLEKRAEKKILERTPETRLKRQLRGRGKTRTARSALAVLLANRRKAKLAKRGLPRLHRLAR